MIRKPTPVRRVRIEASGTGYLIYLPIRTVSEANARDHWRTKARRAKQHRAIAKAVVPSACLGWPGWSITLTRVSTGTLDSDNLTSATKATRDGLTDGLQLTDDSDPRLSWKYDQRKGERGEHAVEVLIERN